MASTLRLLPVVALFFPWGSVHRRTEPESVLISPATLRDRLARGGVVVLHISERAEYDDAHIPGARFLPYASISTHGAGLMLEIPPVATLDSVLESLGISNGTQIVLYAGKNWTSPTARVFLTLDYIGLGDRTSVLDGGFGAWTSDGGAVTKQIPVVTRGTLTVHPRTDVLVDGTAVRGAIGDGHVALIDARSPRFYRGEAEDIHGRQGHIPGAKNVPFVTLLDERGALKPRAALEAALDAAGATSGKRLIAYCAIGQQASVVYLVGRLLGRDVRLYDGSWDDWSQHAEYPIESGRGASR